MSEALFRQLEAAVIDGDFDGVERLAKEVLEKKVDILSAINNGLTAGMEETSDRFDKKEFYVPELLQSARAMKSGLAILLPELTVSKESKGKVAVGTVEGDIHDIGKNIVASLLETAGFTVEDLGVDVPTEKFVEAAKNVDVLGISALLTFSMTNMEDIIKSLEDAGIRDKVKVIIGGAPVSNDYANKIGADGYAEDGVKAVRLVKSIIK